jgi:hypothetical protein
MRHRKVAYDERTEVRVKLNVASSKVTGQDGIEVVVMTSQRK